METKHTPGPWSIDGSIIYGTPVAWPLPADPQSCPRIAQSIVARVLSGDDGNYAHYSEPMARANRQLIASAPVLLEAVQKLAWFIENVSEDTPNRNDLFFEARETWRNAIAQATMEESEWQVCTNGANKRHWYVFFGPQRGKPQKWLMDKNSRYYRAFATMASAQRVADALNRESTS